MLVPSVVERCRETLALGSMARAQDELRKLKQLPKTVETTDHLMVIAVLLGFPSWRGCDSYDIGCWRCPFCWESQFLSL